MNTTLTASGDAAASCAAACEPSRGPGGAGERTNRSSFASGVKGTCGMVKAG